MYARGIYTLQNRHSVRKFELKIFVLTGNFVMSRHWGEMLHFHFSNAFSSTWDSCLDSFVDLVGQWCHSQVSHCREVSCSHADMTFLSPKLKQITYISVWIWDKKGIYLPGAFSMGLNSTLRIFNWLFHFLDTCICSFFPHMVVHTHKQRLPLATGCTEDAAHPGISDLLTLNFLAQEKEIAFVFLNLCSKKGLGKLK